jgi:hypothetical protein
MNEFFKPQNPEDDELITESLGNPKEEVLPPNSIDGQSNPNSQDSQLANDLQEILEENYNSQQYLKESLDQLIRKLRVFKPFKTEEDARQAVEIEPKKKIQIKRLQTEIYTTFLMAFSPERLRKMSQKLYHGEAFNEAWIWTIENYDPDKPDSNFVGYF